MGAGKDPFSRGGVGCASPVGGRWGAELPVPGCSPWLSRPTGRRLPGSLFLPCPASLSRPCLPLGFGLSPDCVSPRPSLALRLWPISVSPHPPHPRPCPSVCPLPPRPGLLGYFPFPSPMHTPRYALPRSPLSHFLRPRVTSCLKAHQNPPGASHVCPVEVQEPWGEPCWLGEERGHQGGREGGRGCCPGFTVGPPRPAQLTQGFREEEEAWVDGLRADCHCGFDLGWGSVPWGSEGFVTLAPKQRCVSMGGVPQADTTWCVPGSPPAHIRPAGHVRVGGEGPDQRQSSLFLPPTGKPRSRERR